MVKLGDVAIFNAPDVVDLNAWVSDAKANLEDVIRETGACMIRGGKRDRTTCQSILMALQVDLVEDVFWSTPRTRVDDKTFTATEYPKTEEIPMHSEMSYANLYPRLLCFQAVRCAESGGQTTLADLDPVSSDIADLTEKVNRIGVTYVRVFHDGLDIPVEKAFGVERRDDVEDVARKLGLEVEFRGNAVKVYQHSKGAIASKSGPVWFNQMQVFHPFSLRPTVRSNLQNLFDENDLPRQARYGDGRRIPDEDIAQVNRAFARHTIDVNWSPGDIVLVDNLRLAHGRRSFEGERLIHVAMGMPTCETTRSSFAF